MQIHVIGWTNLKVVALVNLTFDTGGQYQDL